MLDNQWLLILGLTLVTFIPRVLPLFLLKNKDLSPEFVKWMSYIPVTIFSALVFTDIFFYNNQFMLHPLENLKLLPSLVVALVSIKWNNLFGSIIVGIAAILLMMWGFS